MRQFGTALFLIFTGIISLNLYAKTSIDEQNEIEQINKIIKYVNTHTIEPADKSLMQSYIRDLLAISKKVRGEYKVPANVTEECHLGFGLMVIASGTGEVSREKAKEVVRVICTDEEVSLTIDSIFKPRPGN